MEKFCYCLRTMNLRLLSASEQHEAFAKNTDALALCLTLNWGPDICILKQHPRDFPHDPVVKTPCLQFGGPGFNPWLGN